MFGVPGLDSGAERQGENRESWIVVKRDTLTDGTGRWALPLLVLVLGCRQDTAAPLPEPAAPPEPVAFSIGLLYRDSVPEEYRARFQDAADYFSAVLSETRVRARTVVDAPMHQAHSCTDIPLDEPREVTGLLIVVAIQELWADGILAAASPCKSTLNERPYVGRVTFHPRSLKEHAPDADFERLARHEFLHVLGFGTTLPWQRLTNRTGTEDPHFLGMNAVAAFNAAGGASYTGGKVPVYRGTGHWRDTVLGCEVMSRGCRRRVSPTSAITLAALIDLGYRVDLSMADPYTLP